MAIEIRIDPAALQRLRDLGGDALVCKMIDLFLENTPKRIQAALEGGKTGNWKEVERAGHSMKSSAANLGLDGLQALAREVESLSGMQQAERVAPLLREIEALYPAIRDRLLQERRGGGVSPPCS